MTPATPNTITAEVFTAAMGRAPVNDDLDRCNCPHAGEMGHWGCGWDAEANLPMFMCIPKHMRKDATHK